MVGEIGILRASPGRCAALSVVAGLVAALFSVVVQWPGAVLSPDGWAYWEGSISLLHGEGFRYFGGQPITLWPPGFSLYLAGWQAVLGNRAGTLVVAHALAIGVAAGLLSGCSHALSAYREPGAVRFALGLVVSLMLPIASRAILSESLFMALFGAALLVALSGPKADLADAASRGRELARAALFMAALSALLLTRHAGAVYVPALAWLFRCSAPPGSAARAGRFALAGGAAALAVWLASRAWLGQVWVHARIELDASAPARIGENLWGNLLATWRLLVPRSIVGSIAVPIASAALYIGMRTFGSNPTPSRLPRPVPPEGSGLPFATALAAGCAVAVLPLHGVAGPRFVLPVVALLLLLLGETAERSPRLEARRLVAAVLVCLALVQLARSAYWVRDSLNVDRAGIGWESKLVPACAQGSASCTLGPNEVMPPGFPWIDREFGQPTSRDAESP